MKKTISVCTSMFVILSLLVISCNQKSEETEKPIKIENTLISVALLKDTIGWDLEELRNSVQEINSVIDEIGYPDAGYDIWINQDEDAESRFLHVGNWPSQEIYNTIHNDQRYIDANNAIHDKFGEPDIIQYDRYKRFISK